LLCYRRKGIARLAISSHVRLLGCVAGAAEYVGEYAR
jgi:hypothetical protein